MSDNIARFEALLDLLAPLFKVRTQVVADRLAEKGIHNWQAFQRVVEQDSEIIQTMIQPYAKGDRQE